MARLWGSIQGFPCASKLLSLVDPSHAKNFLEQKCLMLYVDRPGHISPVGGEKISHVLIPMENRGDVLVCSQGGLDVLRGPGLRYQSEILTDTRSNQPFRIGQEGSSC